MRQEIPERIVCAANKCGDKLFLGLRHNDPIMLNDINAAADQEIKCGGSKSQYLRFALASDAQGFLTNKRRWVNRKEAFRIATEQGQIIRKTGGENSKELYSEDLY